MRYLVFSLTLTLLLLPKPAPLAAGGCGNGHVGCPACNYVCEFSVEPAKEKKHCYEVDCKAICIPPLTFPWQKTHGGRKEIAGPATTRCGRVKIVRVLVKEEYECTRCKHTWRAVRIKCGHTDDCLVPASTGADPVVNPPLPMDARLPRRRIEATPVRFEEPHRTSASPPVATKRSFTEFQTGLFK